MKPFIPIFWMGLDIEKQSSETEKDKLDIAKYHVEISRLLTTSDSLENTVRLVSLLAESAKNKQARDLYTISNIFSPLADILSRADSSVPLKILVSTPSL